MRCGRTGKSWSLAVPQRAHPFPTASKRAVDEAWSAAGLERTTPHEARRTFASLMIAAGVTAKALSTFTFLLKGV
jgi:integrase